MVESNSSLAQPQPYNAKLGGRLRNGGETMTAAQFQQFAPGELVPLVDGLCHVVRHEGTGTPIVLVHGFSGPGAVWQQTFDYWVQQNRTVLYYDLWGRGFSARPAGVYNLERYLSQLQQLLDYYHYPQVDLVGWSMGGLIAAGFTAQFPERVCKLGLVAPAGLKAQLHWTARAAALPVLGEFSMNIMGHQLLCNGDGFYVPHKATEYLSLVGSQLAVKGYRRALLSTLRHMPLNDALASVWQPLAAHQHPKAIIWGVDDKVLSIDCLAEFKKQVFDVPECILTETGHVVMFEQPDKLRTWMANFLA